MFPHAGFLTTLFWILDALMTMTSITGFCLLYQFLGMNTCKRLTEKRTGGAGTNILSPPFCLPFTA